METGGDLLTEKPQDVSNIEEDGSSTSQAPTLNTLCLRSRKRTLELFLGNVDAGKLGIPANDIKSLKVKLSTKINDEYGIVKDMQPTLAVSKKTNIAKTTSVRDEVDQAILGAHPHPSRPGMALSEEESGLSEIIQSIPQSKGTSSNNMELAIASQTATHGIVEYGKAAGIPERIQPPKKSQALALRNPYATMKPEWHAPWKLMRVISGHQGWVRAIAIDPTNEWFATGAADRTIKIWDLASGTLKLTLTGHINAVRGLAVSSRHPYLFSCGEDKQVKCWDLELNKVIRHYHGHLSGVYSLTLHPTLDVLVTGGRDSTARVWDMRTKAGIFVLTGHNSTVGAVACQAADPQIITGSHDATIRLWDLAKGTAMATLTHHKKSIRALAIHPNEFSMASGSPDNIKKWKFPEGEFIMNLSGHSSIIHTLAVSPENILVSGGDNGSLWFWDWKTGYNFQKIQTTVQPGSLESESGIFASLFDQTASRYITCEADKSIKIYKEDETATPETHPIEDWKPQRKRW